MIGALLRFIEDNKYEHLDFTCHNAHRMAIDYDDLRYMINFIYHYRQKAGEP
jgi:hypothetical protein